MTNTNRILYWMASRGPMRLTDIAKAVGMSREAAYDSIRLLRKTGFMERDDELYAITASGVGRVADRKATEKHREMKRLDAQAKRAPKLTDAQRAERSLMQRRNDRGQLTTSTGYARANETDSQKMLKLLGDGRLHTCRDLAETNGCPKDLANQRLRWYVNKGYVEQVNPGRRPLQFRLTEAGRAEIDALVPEQKNERIELRALASQPALVRAWSQMAGGAGA